MSAAANALSLTSKKTIYHATTFLEEWLDVIEALPLEIQRNFSLIRELDSDAQALMEKAETSAGEFVQDAQSWPQTTRNERIKSLTEVFARCVQQAEDKVSLAVQTYDMVDRQIRRLDDDLARYEDDFASGSKNHSRLAMGSKITPTKRKKEKGLAVQQQQQQQQRDQHYDGRLSPSLEPSGPTSKASYGGSVKGGPRAAKKKEEGGSGRAGGGSKGSGEMAVDPNEPRYCYCNQVSYGEMVACDNADCDVEWFHYDCVGLKAPPKGKWFCNECAEKLKKGKR